MEIRVFIVSLACLSCLVPPALGKGLVVKAAGAGLAKGALVAGMKGAAVGVGLGIAAKGAVALVAKKALLGVLLKAAALKGKAIVGKKLAIKGVGAVAAKGLKGAISEAIMTESSQGEDGDTTSARPMFTDLLSGTARLWQSTLRLGQAAAAKSRAVYRIISAVPPMLSADFDD